MGGIGNSAPGRSLMDPLSYTDDALGQYGSTASFVRDPLDLFGARASQTQADINDIAYDSAQSGIDAQEEMRQIIAQYLEPYRQSGLDALGDFQRMATTGQTSNALSPEYQWQQEQGMQNINRRLAAAGRRNSTYGGRVAADFLGQLGQEEASRQWGRNLDQIKLGMGAVNSLGGAAQNAGSNVNSLYGNLGNTVNASAQNYGANRAQSLTSAGNALSGAGAYWQYANQYNPNGMTQTAPGWNSYY